MNQIHIQLKTGAILHGYLHEDNKLRRTMLIFPGGGYTYCSKREGEPIALSYMEYGYQTFVLEYITSDCKTWIDIWESANEAIALLHSKQDKWYIEVRELIVIGFSAGGHLAGMLGAKGNIRPAAVILCYPAIIDSLMKLMSPKLYGVNEQIDELTPPMFVFSTFEDHTVPVRNTIRLLQALNDWHIPFETHIFQWGHHGLSLANEVTANGDSKNIDEHAAHWFALSIEWLDRLFTNTKKEKQYVGLHDTPIEILIQNELYKEAIYTEFPILLNKEIMEALGHFTLEELRKRYK